MVIKSAIYELTAANDKQYPKFEMPEIVMVGRSNVGKSSIINTLTGKKNLARVGSSPGKTRLINFYNINDSFRLVDLPGYGYSSVSKQEKESWAKLIETYLSSRELIKLILLVIDIRHAPTEDDIMMLEWLRANNKNYAIVANKADKLSRSQVILNIADIRNVLNESNDNIRRIIPFSSERKQGKDELLSLIQIDGLAR